MIDVTLSSRDEDVDMVCQHGSENVKLEPFRCDEEEDNRQTKRETT
jgi:hypothetical protein